MSREPRPPRQAHSVEELTSDDLVLSLGDLRPEQVAALVTLEHDNTQVVLTGERRRHYLTEHPDAARHENKLTELVLHPDEAHRNRKDPLTAIFYQRLDEGHYLRVAIVLQPNAGELKHSVFSFRLAKEREVEKGRAAGRVVWRRK